MTKPDPETLRAMALEASGYSLNRMATERASDAIAAWNAAFAKVDTGSLFDTEPQHIDLTLKNLSASGDGSDD